MEVSYLQEDHEMISMMNYHDGSALPTNMTIHGGNEEIVIDERAAFSPSDLVQQKLQRLLPDAAIPVSCLHSGREVRRYTT
jgi:hypothetical protein